MINLELTEFVNLVFKVSFGFGIMLTTNIQVFFFPYKLRNVFVSISEGFVIAKAMNPLQSHVF
jgi:hypothetical protein